MYSYLWDTTLGGFSPVADLAQIKMDPLSFCGTPDSTIRIEVFSDFQCPHCRLFYLDIIKPLVRDYSASKNVYVLYHDYPLDMHPFGRLAARLALAAMHIGKDQWLRVTDALYVNQEQWSQDGKFDPILAKVLKPEELARIKLLSVSPTVENDLNQEILLGNGRQITGTPTYFVMSRTGRQQRLNQVVGYAVIKDYIERFLK
jgi:protein-disulfide isomerase